MELSIVGIIGILVLLVVLFVFGMPVGFAMAVIDEDDTVTIRIARSEMGQGTLTGLAQSGTARSAEQGN